MIKTFEQFINENYSEKVVINSLCEEYGAPLFNEVSESLAYEINNSINEGKITINSKMIEEGLFDTIGKLFKKGANKSSNDIELNNLEIDALKKHVSAITNVPVNVGSAIENMGNEINKLEMDNEVSAKIEKLCKAAEDICAKLSEKEEQMYNTITEKMNAANEAIKEFTDMSIAKIKEIAEISKNKVSDIISAVILFCKKMAEFAKKALEKIGKGIVIALALPFVFAFSVYKGALKVCEMLVEKVKDGAKFVGDTFNKIKTAISSWISETLNKAKELLKNASDAVKDGAKKAYQSVGKAYLAIVAILGQLASDAKDAISEAYNDFIDSAKELADDVKEFISEKWGIVSNWCKKTASSFAEGVKNVWNKVKEKVVSTVDSAKDAYKALEDNDKSTWDDVKNWADDKQKDYMKANVKYSVDKWGKDEVNSWFENL